MTSTMDTIVIPPAIRDLDLTVVRGKLYDRATRGREVINPPVALDNLDQGKHSPCSPSVMVSGVR